jgi:hypothetical protein
VGDELGYARNLPLRYRREAIPYIAFALLLAVGLVLTLSPMMHRSVEKIKTVLVSMILVFLGSGYSRGHPGVLLAGGRHEGTRGGRQLPAFRQGARGRDAFGAKAFAGAGGTNNLCQSNYA